MKADAVFKRAFNSALDLVSTLSDGDPLPSESVLGEQFEVRSARALAALPENSPLWQRLEALREEHGLLLGEIGHRYYDRTALESRFHRLINAAAPNRFIDSFYDIITATFHYHDQWNKQDERQRNEVAIREHLGYIEALLSRIASLVELACRAQLSSAKETLIRSFPRVGVDSQKAGPRRRQTADA